MNNINVEEILKGRIRIDEYGNINGFSDSLKRAIKEIVEAVIDECSETKVQGVYDKGVLYNRDHDDKKSILSVKKLVEYD